MRVAVAEKSGVRVDAIALRAQIQLEVARRRYLPEESALLSELFGEPSRYADTLKPMLWTHAAQTVPAFEREVEFDLPVPCSYDFEVAAQQVSGVAARRLDSDQRALQRHGAGRRTRRRQRRAGAVDLRGALRASGRALA